MEETQHGIDVATYANGHGDYKPFIQCLCGEGWRDEKWEFVGQSFDEHLAERQATAKQ